MIPKRKALHPKTCLPMVLLVGLLTTGLLKAQRPALPLLSFQPADSLHRGRLWTAVGAGSLAYGASMIGLYKAWYAGYPAAPFHAFDDWGEWQQMDKAGHALSAYAESRWVAGMARWTGFSRKKAAWWGFAGGQLIQTSFEIYDGFSRQWGFSWADMGFNMLGGGLFLGQELAWQDQRIVLKLSAWPVSFSDTPLYSLEGGTTGPYTTLNERSQELYGTGPGSLFLKNYNASAIWLSVNPHAFFKDNNAKWPHWLNLAVGMGANNMFSGFGYSWTEPKDCSGPDCRTYRADPGQYPRYRQFFFSPDIDLTRLKVKKPFWRSVLGLVNVFKIPAPTLEYRTKGTWRAYFFYF